MSPVDLCRLDSDITFTDGLEQKRPKPKGLGLTKHLPNALSDRLGQIIDQRSQGFVWQSLDMHVILFVVATHHHLSTGL